MKQPLLCRRREESLHSKTNISTPYWRILEQQLRYIRTSCDRSLIMFVPMHKNCYLQSGTCKLSCISMSHTHLVQEKLCWILVYFLFVCLLIQSQLLKWWYICLSGCWVIQFFGEEARDWSNSTWCCRLHSYCDQSVWILEVDTHVHDCTYVPIIQVQSGDNCTDYMKV